MMCNLCDSLCTSHCRRGGAYQCSPSNNFPPLPRSSEALWLLPSANVTGGAFLRAAALAELSPRDHPVAVDRPDPAPLVGQARVQSDVGREPRIRPYHIRAVDAGRHEALHKSYQLDLDSEVDLCVLWTFMSPSTPSRRRRRGKRTRAGTQRLSQTWSATPSPHAAQSE